MSEGRQTRLVALSGPAGIGKSALLGALEAPLLARGGALAIGRFSPDSDEVPYRALIEATTSLAQQLLTRSEGQLKRFRERAVNDLGPLLRAAVELVPALALALDLDPDALAPIPSIGPSEARNQLHLVFARTLALFSLRAPVVFALDDAQWIDPSSLELMRALLTSDEVGSLAFVLAYRDDQVGDDHPLQALLDARPDAPTSPRKVHLHLRPLADAELSAMLADTLGREVEDLAELTALVSRKTDNNPLFVSQFLTHLSELGLLKVGPEGWTWSAQGIRSAGLPDDVLGLMQAKLSRLESAELEVIERAACIGAQFSARLLSKICGRPQDELVRLLYRLELAGLIDVRGSHYAFAHDHLREVTRAFVPEPQRHRLRQRIGHYLKELLTPADLRDRLYELVDHLDAGRRPADALSDPQRRELARYNTQAGERALGSAAWPSALRYLERALELLAPELDDARVGGPSHELAFCAHFAHAQALSLYGSSAAAAEAFDELLDWRLSTLAFGKVVRRRVRLLGLEQRYEEGVAFGIAGLARCGLRRSPHPKAATMVVELVRAWAAVAKLTLDDFASMPPSRDEQANAAMHIIAALKESAHATDPKLYVALIGLHVRLLIRHGYHPTAPSALAQLAGTAGIMDKTARGDALVEQALALIELRETPPLTRNHTVSAALLFAWPGTRAFRSFTAQLAPHFAELHETGDLTSAAYVHNFGLHLLYESGLDLRALLEIDARMDRENRARRAADMTVIGDMPRRCAEVLSDPTREPVAGLLADPTDAVPKIPFYYAARVWQVFALLALGDYPLAHALVEPISDDYEKVLIGNYSQPRAAVAVAVLAAWRSPDAPASEHRRLLAKVKRAAKLSRRWADQCPDNFAANAELSAAELARLRGKDDDAAAAYERALDAAIDHDRHYLAGLAGERLAQLSASRRPVRRERLRWSVPRGKLADRRRELERRLAELLTGRRDADRDALARAVASHRCTTMISVTIRSSEHLRHEPELLRFWLELFAAWPDLPPGQFLLPVLCLVDSHRPGGWRRLAFRRNARVGEKLAESLARDVPKGLEMVVLDRLESVREDDVHAWIEEHAGAFLHAAGSEVRSPIALRERLIPKVRRLFQRQGEEGLPMEVLALELRGYLEVCLQQRELQGGSL